MSPLFAWRGFYLQQLLEVFSYHTLRHMKTLWFAAALFVIVYPLAQANEAPSNQCGKQSSPIPWEYCITHMPRSQSRTVAYYFHGGPGSAREWFEANADIYSEWQRTDSEAPIVVAISFAPEWILTQKNASPLSGLYQVFTEAVMPIVESNLLKGAVDSRLLIGLSMGGYSAVQLLLRNPEKFQKVALLCPMLVNLSPDATDEEIKEFRARSRAPEWNPTRLMRLMQKVIPDRVTWGEESPFELASKLLWKKSPNVYLSYGEEDGFIDGIEEFAQIARTQKVSLEDSSVKGGHCTYNAKGVANFLVR